jgi:hypothetical protein
MSLFLTTFFVTILCCLLMGVGLLVTGKPLEGGCGKAPPGLSRCEECPNRDNHEHGKCRNQGDQ